MVNSDNKHRFGGKLIYILIAAVVLAVVGLVAVVFYIVSDSKPKGSESNANLTEQETVAVQIKSRGDVNDQAAKYISSGDWDNFKNTYKDAIQKETDPTMKVRLALDEYLEFCNHNKYDDAEKVLKLAEDYSDDKFLVADALARFYSTLKIDYKQATEYYKLAAKFADSKTNKSGYTAEYYNDNAVRTSGLVK